MERYLVDTELTGDEFLKQVQRTVHNKSMSTITGQNVILYLKDRFTADGFEIADSNLNEIFEFD